MPQRVLGVIKIRRNVTLRTGFEWKEVIEVRFEKWDMNWKRIGTFTWKHVLKPVLKLDFRLDSKEE